MVERTVYVGATVQVIVRLATGEPVQAAVTNVGTASEYPQGTAVLVRFPAEALRVLAAGEEGPATAQAQPAEAVAAGHT